MEAKLQTTFDQHGNLYSSLFGNGKEEGLNSTMGSLATILLLNKDTVGSVSGGSTGQVKQVRLIPIICKTCRMSYLHQPLLESMKENINSNGGAVEQRIKLILYVRHYMLIMSKGTTTRPPGHLPPRQNAVQTTGTGRPKGAVGLNSGAEQAKKVSINASRWVASVNFALAFEKPSQTLECSRINSASCSLEQRIPRGIDNADRTPQEFCNGYRTYQAVYNGNRTWRTADSV
jgi:hypothetical protein